MSKKIAQDFASKLPGKWSIIPIEAPETTKINYSIQRTIWAGPCFLTDETGKPLNKIPRYGIQIDGSWEADDIQVTVSVFDVYDKGRLLKEFEIFDEMSFEREVMAEVRWYTHLAHKSLARETTVR